MQTCEHEFTWNDLINDFQCRHCFKRGKKLGILRGDDEPCG